LSCAAYRFHYRNHGYRPLVCSKNTRVLRESHLLQPLFLVQCERRPEPRGVQENVLCKVDDRFHVQFGQLSFESCHLGLSGPIGCLRVGSLLCEAAAVRRRRTVAIVDQNSQTAAVRLN
jgi:hypothetical protein